jgi:hypothetical protein
MADVLGAACMWTGLGHKHRPRYYARVDQLMLIIGPLHTLEATAYKKRSAPRHRTLACMRLPLGHATHRAIDVPMGPECAVLDS